MEIIVNRLAREMVTVKRHPVDRNLPAHWDGIEFGQTEQERSMAILRNISTDQELRSRGFDPVEARRTISGVEALETVNRIKNRR